jgi:hypothetical protein
VKWFQVPLRNLRHDLLPPLCAVAVAVAVAWCVLPAVPAAGEILIETRPDGTRVVRNVGGGPSSAAATSTRLRPAPHTDLERAVDEEAAARGLDPRLVRAVIQAESAWNRHAVSHKGAMGLMQLMPATAVSLAVDDPYDEVQNVRGGTAYLAQLYERFGDLTLAVAAYNAGPGAVERYGGVPPFAETRAYVRRVLSLYQGRDVGAEALSATPPVRPARRSAASRGGSPQLVVGPNGRKTLTNTASTRR